MPCFIMLSWDGTRTKSHYQFRNVKFNCFPTVWGQCTVLNMQGPIYVGLITEMNQIVSKSGNMLTGVVKQLASKQEDLSSDPQFGIVGGRVKWIPGA